MMVFDIMVTHMIELISKPAAPLLCMRNSVGFSSNSTRHASLRCGPGRVFSFISSTTITQNQYSNTSSTSHVPEAWIDRTRRDEKDGEVGIVGYEIPFNQHSFVYKPSRDMAVVDVELDEVSREIMALLKEVHS